MNKFKVLTVTETHTSRIAFMDTYPGGGRGRDRGRGRGKGYIPYSISRPYVTHLNLVAEVKNYPLKVWNSLSTETRDY